MVIAAGVRSERPAAADLLNLEHGLTTGQTTELVEYTHRVEVLPSSKLLIYTDVAAETPGVWALRL